MLDAHFEASRGDQITVPYGAGANVARDLSTGASAGISGATVCVETQTQGAGGGLEPVAVTRTDASGHFTYKLPAGPNRTVVLGYRHGRFQIVHTVRYYAHSRPTIRLTPRKVRTGGRIRITGRVPGPQAGGRVVVLQASAPHSRRWFTFNRATANEAGFLLQPLPLRCNHGNDHLPDPGGGPPAGRLPLRSRPQQAGAGKGRGQTVATV